MHLNHGLQQLFELKKDHSAMAESYAKMDLLEFVVTTHRQIYNETFIIKPFHVELCELLMKCARREVEHPLIVVNMPPRFSKSRLASMYMLYCFLRNPKAKFIYASYSQRLSLLMSREVREGYKFLKKNARTSLAQENSENWQTSEGGLLWTSTIPSGAITGVGAGSLEAEPFSGDLIIDDAIKPSDCFYENIRANVQESFVNTFFSRRNNWDRVNIIVFMQRLHTHDLCGWIFNESKLPHVRYTVRALNENNESIFPERVSTEILLNLKDSSPYTFASQQQQSPIAYSGSFFIVDRIKKISLADFRKNEWRMAYMVRGWDIAGIRKENKTTERHDWTRGVLLGVDYDGTSYIMDCVSYRGTIDESINLIVRTAKSDGARVTQVIEEEPGSSGKFLTQYVQEHPDLKGLQLYITKPHQNKRLRAAPLADFINSGKMTFVDDSEELNKWVMPLFEEFASFPDSIHDDSVDATASAFNYLFTVKKYIV